MVLADSSGSQPRDGASAPDRYRNSSEPASGHLASWSSFDIIPCLDGKARRIERAPEPLVNGVSAGVVRCGGSGAPGAEGGSYGAGGRQAGDEAGRETFPLAFGQEARVMRLRGYGNAIVPAVAAEFIRAYMETL
jgi:DNA (cytosine-5)-methyltransferase 1